MPCALGSAASCLRSSSCSPDRFGCGARKGVSADVMELVAFLGTLYGLYSCVRGSHLWHFDVFFLGGGPFVVNIAALAIYSSLVGGFHAQQ